MTASGNNPNINPADNDSLAGMIRFAFSQLLKGTDGLLPAQVISYDRSTNRVQVQLLISMITTSGAQVSRAQIANIPVINIGGGGYIINFPLKPGDIGFIMANDRDISLFLQAFAEAPPNTQRVKSFSDGIFIPSVLTGYTIAGGDSSNMVIQSLDGTVKISLGSSNITISSPTSITIDSPTTTVTGKLIVNGLTKCNAGFAAYGIATGAYTGYFGGNMYVLGNGAASGAFLNGQPAPPPP